MISTTLFATVTSLLGPLSQPVQELDAAAILRESAALLRDAKTAQGSFYMAANEGSVQKVEFKLAKPNLFALINDRKLDLFDGKVHTVVLPKSKTFEKRNAAIVGVPYLIGFEAFTNPSENLPNYGQGIIVQLEGKPAVKRSYEANGESIDVYIDVESKLPRGWDWRNGSNRAIVRFKSVVLNEPIAEGSFSYTAPADFTETEPIEARGLLAVGATAPDFKDATGKKFSSLHARNNFTVLAFFDFKNPASTDMLKALQNIAKTERRAKVGVVGLSIGSSEAEVNPFRKVMGFPLLLNAAGADSARTMYGVVGLPTVFVIDKNNRIVHRQLGFDEAELRKLIKQLKK